MQEALAAWGDPQLIGTLSGGNRNTVWEIRLGGRRLAARTSRRSPASLEWEISLLDHLARNGMRVPVAVPALDGRRHVRGVIVQTWLEGSPPGPGDWPAVEAALRKLHQLTANWPQRPGFVSTRDLLTTSHGGDVDLSVMPPETVAACRRAWARLEGARQAVVHGDAGPANIRIAGQVAGLLDWDEARRDYCDLDLADLPVSSLPRTRQEAARPAITAWEVANGWTIEPSYARQQPTRLLSHQQHFH